MAAVAEGPLGVGELTAHGGDFGVGKGGFADRARHDPEKVQLLPGKCLFRLAALDLSWGRGRAEGERRSPGRTERSIPPEGRRKGGNGHDRTTAVPCRDGDDRRAARVPAPGPGPGPRGGAQAPSIPRPEVPGADQDVRAVGGGDPGGLERAGEDRDLSLDVAWRLAAAALPPGRRRGRRHRVDGERLHARALSADARSSSCRRSTPTTSARPTSRCATCSTTTSRPSSPTCTCSSCTSTPARRSRWRRSSSAPPRTPRG